MRVVYILGAGFSYPAGIPLMKDLYFKINELASDGKIDSDNHRQWYSAIEAWKANDTGTFIEHKRKCDLTNIENLLSLCNNIEPHLLENIIISIAETIDYLTGLVEINEPYNSSRYKAFLQWVNDYYNAQHDVFNFDKKRQVPVKTNYIEMFFLTALGFPNIPHDEVTIISFNYDLLLERLGCRLLPHKPDVSNMTYIVGNHAYNRNQRISIIKPNGSLNYGFCRNCQSFCLSEDLSKTLKDCPKVNCEGDIVPFIRLPGIKSDKDIDTTAAVIAKKVYEADRIVFAGFSMPETDEWFWKIIERELERKTLPYKAFIMCPNLDIRESGYRVLFENKTICRYIKHGVGDGDDRHQKAERCFRISNNSYALFIKELYNDN